MQRKNSLDGVAISLLLGCCLFWGFQQVLVKATIAEVPPVFQAAMRFAGATVILWVWCRVRGIALFEADGSLWAGLLAGSLFATEFGLMYLGLQFTTASRLTVFVYTAPFWVAILMPLLNKTEHLRMTQWLGLALAFGAVLFALREGLSASSRPQQWIGDVMALGAGLFWGLTTVVIRGSKLTSVSAEKLLFYQVAVSMMTLPVFSIMLHERWVFDFSTFALTSLALQTVLGAFISYLAWMWMLGRYPATKISVFAFLTPVFALLFGTLWLEEPVTPSLMASIALVGVGIVLVNRQPKT
jgi:drug/metabolite transporter (DMT)-like permease